MRALDRKLIRDIRRLWAQSLAIAMVLACGVLAMVMMYGAERSLTETRDTYYERARFPDVWSSAARAPKSLVPEIAAIEGVSQVEARISEIAVLPTPTGATRTTAADDAPVTSATFPESVPVIIPPIPCSLVSPGPRQSAPPVQPAVTPPSTTSSLPVM